MNEKTRINPERESSKNDPILDYATEGVRDPLLKNLLDEQKINPLQ